MKKIKLNLILNLLKKDFLFHRHKKLFLVLNYDFVIKSLKQLLKLKFLSDLPIYIVSKEKKQNIMLKKFLITYLKAPNIHIVDHQILTKESINIILSSKTICYQTNNIYFKFDDYTEQTNFNFYKIFVDLSNIKKLLFLIVILRRVYEKC